MQASAAGQLALGCGLLGAYSGALLLGGLAAKWALVGRLQPHTGYSIYSGLSLRRMLLVAVETSMGALRSARNVPRSHR